MRRRRIGKRSHEADEASHGEGEHEHGCLLEKNGRVAGKLNDEGN